LRGNIRPMSTTRRIRLGTGYRAKVRSLAAAGLSEEGILESIPGLTPWELQATLSTPSRRGRPPKAPTISTLDGVKRWRSTKRPRTIRAAVECIDFLLSVIELLEADARGPMASTLCRSGGLAPGEAPQGTVTRRTLIV
jgi:hypothetical protein